MKKYSSAIIILILALLISSCGNKKDANMITASGTVESVDVTVSSKLSGQIKQITIKEGDKVKKGDLLVELDHDLLDIQLRQAEARVEQANAQLKLLLSGARKEDIEASEQSLKQAKINLDLAKEDKERFTNLYDTRTITKKQYDDAVARYDLSLAQYNAAKENLNKIKSIIRPEEIESAKANIKSLIASVDLLKKNIEDAKVYAPVDGFVSKKFVEAGELVSPQSSLMKISDLQTVDLVIYLTEVEMAKVKLGQNADIKIDAFRDKTYKGEIIYISPEAEFTPKNIQTQDERTKLVFAVKIRIPNQQFELKPGMPADASLTIGN
jgi:HlyD family secretion protein